MSLWAMFKPGDLLVLITAGLIAYFWSVLPGSSGEAEYLRLVTGDGEDTLRLNRDTVIHTGHVTVEVMDGMAAITESDCPNQYCTAAGWLRNPGQTAACMPNGTLIEILGNYSPSLDAVSY